VAHEAIEQIHRRFDDGAPSPYHTNCTFSGHENAKRWNDQTHSLHARYHSGFVLCLNDPTIRSPASDGSRTDQIPWLD
jgi:hypothetical protein